jgi:deoxyribonuclease-4
MFGSHLSISGGVHKALLDAERLGMDTVQVFTANQRQWRAPALDPAEVERWKTHARRLKFKKTVSHDSYLINLCATNPELWEKSVEAFTQELRRCETLGIPYLVTHPGCHMGAGEEAGLKQVARALDIVHDAVPEARTITCLEITAGQGSALGYRLEHLASIIEMVKSPERLGVCLDTAHLFAAGYDFRGRKYAEFRKDISRTVGLKSVKVWHLNDSKKPLGSRVDRHDHIGRGMIGLDGFRPIVRDEAWGKIPKILETPKDKDETGRDWDAVNLETLRGLA